MSQTTATADTLAARRKAAFNRADADVVLVHDATDIRYLTGLTEGSQTLLLTKGPSILLSNRMFQDRAPLEAPGCDVRIAPAKPAGRTDDDRIADVLSELDAKTLAVATDSISLRRFRALVERVGEDRIVEMSDLVGPLRMVKDEQELAMIRRAVDAQIKAMQAMITKGTGHWVGRTERSLAAELIHTMIDCGADADGFDHGCIVASGPNSAACHHRPSDRVVEAGDGILIDWGAEVAGYRSDMTRMVYTGEMPEPLKTIHDHVASALDTSTKAVKPGVAAKDLDKIARDHLAEFDDEYPDLFRHSLGHGVGLAVHEGPSLSRSDTPLAPGMVLAIEPGIYYDDRGGVRLENTVVVTKDGHEVLGELPLALFTEG